MATVTNTKTAILHKILSRALRGLRESVIMPRLISVDFQMEAGMKGDTINVPIGVGKTASAVTPSEFLVPSGSTNLTRPLVMDQHFHVDFGLTDKEQVELARNEHFMPTQMEESLRALAFQVNSQILGEYYKIGNLVVASGTDTIPFEGTATVADILAVNKNLNESLCPRDQRRFVIDYTSEINLLSKPQFSEWQKSSDNQVIINAELGRKVGFDWFTDDQLPLTRTIGTYDGAARINGALAIGATTVVLDNVTTSNNFRRGDVITFVGHTREYAVQADAAEAGNAITLTISPELKAAVDDDSVVTRVAGQEDARSTYVNLAFRRDAFQYVTRPLARDTQLPGSPPMTVVPDPVSGLIVRMEPVRQNKQTLWDLDILWGSTVIRPEYACRYEYHTA